MTARTLVIACGALANEILAVNALNGWDYVVLQCLPANLHLRPDMIPDAVEKLVLERRAEFATIFVAYADCGTGGLLAQKCTELGVKMIKGPHCYSFFEGNDVFAQRDEITAFYLTDFLARQFDSFVWKPMGLDKHPELLELYFGNYEKLVYLAQTDDPALTKKAKIAAQKLGLAFERRFTGYGDLPAVLAVNLKRDLQI